MVGAHRRVIIIVIIKLVFPWVKREMWKAELILTLKFCFPSAYTLVFVVAIRFP